MRPMARRLTKALAGPLLVTTLLLAGCSGGHDAAPRGPAAAPEAAPLLSGEQTKTGAYLAYEHQVAVRIAAERLDERLDALRNACTEERFGPCDLLGLERSSGAYPSAQVSVRTAPDAVDKLVALAAQDATLESRSSRAEDLAQAVGDTDQRLERLQRQRTLLQGYQARQDLAVADLLGVARELADVETQLADIQRDAERLRQRIATNRLTVDFSADRAPAGRLARLGEATGNLLDTLTEGTLQALQVLVYGLPFLVLLFPLALLLRALWRRAVRRRDPPPHP